MTPLTAWSQAQPPKAQRYRAPGLEESAASRPRAGLLLVRSRAGWRCRPRGPRTDRPSDSVLARLLAGGAPTADRAPARRSAHEVGKPRALTAIRVPAMRTVRNAARLIAARRHPRQVHRKQWPQRVTGRHAQLIRTS